MTIERCRSIYNSQPFVANDLERVAFENENLVNQERERAQRAAEDLERAKLELIEYKLELGQLLESLDEYPAQHQRLKQLEMAVLRCKHWMAV